MKLVFAGNCQAYSLSFIYAELFAAERGEDVAWIDVWNEHRIDDWRRILAEADVVVEQIFTGAPRVDLRRLSARAPHVTFPDVRGNFVWPFGNVSRVDCPSSARKGAGPYTPEVGDVFLNDLIRQRVMPDEAARRYMDLDIAKRTNLDRLVEIMLRQQRDRDAAAGMSVAAYIEDRLTRERLFTTPGHPTAALFRHLAHQVYERLGIDAAGLRSAHDRLAAAPFDRWTEAPVHPGVAVHLGLRYVDGDTRYQHVREGRFDFAECARRYVANDWSVALVRGCELFGREAYDDALVELDRGLAEAPRSAFGHSRRALAYRALGDLAKTLEAADRALSLDPEDRELIDIHGQAVRASAA